VLTYTPIDPQPPHRYMEDVDFAYPAVNCGSRSVSLYGVLDGHGGADCAAYVAEELPSKMAATLRSKGKGTTDGEVVCSVQCAVCSE